MTINEFVDKWKEWKEKDISKLNITINEFDILNQFMEFIYDCMVERPDVKEFNIPEIILKEFNK